MNQPIIWSPGVTLAEIEKQVILTAFRFFKGNKTTTSTALGISVRTLDVRLEEYERFGKIEEIQDANRRREQEKFLTRQRGNPTANEFGVSVLTAIQPPVSSIRSASPVANASKTFEAGEGTMGTTAGVRLESVVEIKPQQTMPVHERKEIQSVPPKHPSPNHPKKSR